MHRLCPFALTTFRVSTFAHFVDFGMCLSVSSSEMARRVVHVTPLPSNLPLRRREAEQQDGPHVRRPEPPAVQHLDAAAHHPSRPQRLPLPSPRTANFASSRRQSPTTSSYAPATVASAWISSSPSAPLAFPSAASSRPNPTPSRYYGSCATRSDSATLSSLTRRPPHPLSSQSYRTFLFPT